MSRFFDTSWTYESLGLDYSSLPADDLDLFFLGKKFRTVADKNELKVLWKNLFWITYRKGMVAVCDVENLTSDQGWGCMHRSGQMLLANVFVRIKSGPSFMKASSEPLSEHEEILNLFIDRPDAVFSIHSITQLAQSLIDKQPGEWLGPNAVCQVLKNLFEMNDRPLFPDLFLYVCTDGMLIIDEINNLLMDPNKKNEKLLLMIPLRLGIAELDSQYFNSLNQLMQLEQFCGFVGGKPNHASWFFGYMSNNELLCLDPHTTQPYIDPFLQETRDFSSYHCEYMTRIPVSQLDPSLALAFYCVKQDFLEFCSTIQDIFNDKSSASLFDVVQEAPETVSSSMADWPLSSEDSFSSDGAGADFEVIDKNENTTVNDDSND